MRTVDIIASHNDHRQFKGLLVRVNQHFSCSLGSGVWVGRGKNTGFEQIIGIIFDLAIDLIGRDVDELFDPDLLGTFQDNVCSVDIGMGELIGISEAQINVRLSSKVEDSINVVSLQAIHNLGGIGDISMVESKVPLIVKGSSIVQRCAVIEFIEGDDVIGVGVCQCEMSHQPASAMMGND
jgi:hypothetical protein